MSDWRLAKKDGELTWTSPSVPNGGTVLYTSLSPTLILGCKKKGDAIPVNYVKVPDVTRVSLSTPTGILIERRTGTAILLVCNAGPQEAASWAETIQRATSGGGSLAATSRSGSNKPGSPAGANPTAASAASASGGAGANNAISGGAARETTPAGAGGSSTPTAPPKPANANMNNIANALQNDLRQRPIANPNAASAVGGASTPSSPASLQGGGVGGEASPTSAANAAALQNNSSIQPPGQGQGVRLPVDSTSGGTNLNDANNSGLKSFHVVPSNQASPASNNNMNNSSASFGGMGSAANSTAGTTNPNSPNNNQHSPVWDHDFRHPTHGQQQQPQQQGQGHQGGQQGGQVQPLNLSQLAGSPTNNYNDASRKLMNNQQQQQQNNNNNNNNNNASQSNFGNPNQQQQQQNASQSQFANQNALGAAGNQQGGGQQQSQGNYYNPNSPGGASNSNFGASGSGVMKPPQGLPSQQQIHQQQMQNHQNQTQQNVTPNNITGRPVAQTTLNKFQGEIVTPGSGQSSIHPVQAPPLGSGGGTTPGGFSNSASASNFGSSASGHYNQQGLQGQSGQFYGNSGNSASAAAAAGGGGAMNNSSLVSNLPDGSLHQASRRHGMMVELPATQHVNRAIAPNASAVWKEWRDPKGVLWVMHEGSGLLQRLNPGEDEFQTYYPTEEEAERARSQPADYHSPNHMSGDPTLNMGDMTVHNLQHYGTAGAAQDGISYPPIPAANLTREMVIGVPRGQFSPSRRTQVEPLAVPRTNEDGYKGKRIHRFTLSGTDDPNRSVVEHQVQSLDTEGAKWDPTTGQVMARNADQQRSMGDGQIALRVQWEHVKGILQQGRYFKKHSFRRTNQSAFRFVFLSSDTSWVCAVPTSDVMVKVLPDGQMAVGPESQQYFPPDSKAMAMNSIEAVVLGIEEDSLRYRAQELDLDSTFCIISRTHMLILECGSPQEARFFCDAWNFFMFYSRPERPKPVPQMKAPVSYGTRGGIRW